MGSYEIRETKEILESAKHQPGPHALTREQVDEPDRKWSKENDLLAGDPEAMPKLIAAQRQALSQQAQAIDALQAECRRIECINAQQAQEMERLEGVCLDRLRSGQRLDDENILLRQSLAAMTAERDEAVLQVLALKREAWDLVGQRNTAQARCKDLEEQWNAAATADADLDYVAENASLRASCHAFDLQAQELQARVKELEEGLVESEKAAYDIGGVIDHLKATLAERERQLQLANVDQLHTEAKLNAAVQEAGRLQEAAQNPTREVCKMDMQQALKGA